MTYRHSLQQSGTLLVIAFEGAIPPEEEREALVSIASAPDFEPEARVLVDRRRARMTVEPKDVGPQVELAKSRLPAASKPKLALLVSSDYDYGMCRMLELTASAREGPHEIRVFRDLDETCAWLEVEPAEIEWP